MIKRVFNKKKRLSHQSPLRSTGKIFNSLLTETNYPYFLHDLYDYILENGQVHNGIFRQSGEKEEVNEMKLVLNTGKGVLDLNRYQMYSIADLIKHYFGTMLEPLVPYSLYVSVVSIAQSSCSQEEMKKALKNLLRTKLPFANYKVLKSLTQFISKYLEFEIYTQMNSENFSIVFTPSILRVKRVTVQYTIDLKELIKLVQLLIENYEFFFSEKESNLPNRDIQNSGVKLDRKRRDSSLRRSLVAKELVIDEGVGNKWNEILNSGIDDEKTFLYFVSSYENRSKVVVLESNDGYDNMLKYLQTKDDVSYIGCKIIGKLKSNEEQKKALFFLIIYIPSRISGFRRSKLFYHRAKVLKIFEGTDFTMQVTEDEDIQTNNLLNRLKGFGEYKFDL